MPIIQLPSGEWVVKGDTTTPPDAELEVVAQDGTTMASNRKGRAPGTPRKSDAEQRADAIQKSGLGQGDFARSVTNGVSMGFADEIGGGISAATKGLYNALTKGDVSEIGKEYTTARDTQRILDQRGKQNSPILSTVGELGGAIVNPVGEGAALARGVGTLAGKAGLSRVAAKAAGVADRIGRAGPVAKAALAGANQGALNAAGNATDLENVPAALGTGAAIGGALGGVFGGAVKLGTGAANAIRDRSASAAERVAFGKAGERIRQARTTPQAIEDELAASQAGGVDARFMDVSPGTRADAAYYSRKPNLDASNDLKAVSDERMMGRGGNLVNQIEKNADIPSTGTDSGSLIDDIVAKRRAQGKADYAVGGALDAPVNWSDDLDKFWAEAPVDTRNTMLRARAEIEGRRGDPDAYMTPTKGANGEDTFTIVPTMRSFDYLKRGFDGEIGAAKSAGDMPKVQRLQSELGQFKELFRAANPNDEYAALLLRQRTGFEREEAATQAQGWLRRLTSTTTGDGPRKVLKEIKALQPHQQQDARTGILDGLLSIDNRANPLGTFRSLTRNPKQREVLEFAFGGKKQLDDFMLYLNREIKAAAADGMVSGPQSITSAVQLAGEGGDETIGNIFNQVLRGYAFGGLPGAASGAMRQFGGLATGMGGRAQEAYGGILAGRGGGLAKGVESAQQFGLKRAEGTTRRARRAAKAGQQLYTDQLGKQ